MIMGVHSILFSRNAEADRAFFRDVLELSAVDAGHGWLIFGLPPAEMAIHPKEPAAQESSAPDGLSGASMYLMTRDLRAALEKLRAKGVACGAVHKERWGSRTTIPLPGGGTVGLYEPHHRLAIEEKKEQ